MPTKKGHRLNSGAPSFSLATSLLFLNHHILATPLGRTDEQQ